MRLVVWDKGRSRVKLRVWGDFIVEFAPDSHSITATRQDGGTIYASGSVEYAGEAEPGTIEVMEK